MRSIILKSSLFSVEKSEMNYHQPPISEWYNPSVLQDLELNDILRMRKPHPCGGMEWRVVRLGADIGLECLTCGRRIMLARRALKHRMKANMRKEKGQDLQDGA